MCEIHQSSTPANGGGINLNLTCKTSGKPITKTNKFGMYCDDMCTLKEDKVAYGQLTSALAHLDSPDAGPQDFAAFANDLAKMFKE